MTTINERLGIKRAGKRRMMKLPADAELRTKLTGAHCPKCDRTGATLSKTEPDHFFCTWCSHTWKP